MYQLVGTRSRRRRRRELTIERGRLILDAVQGVAIALSIQAVVSTARDGLIANLHGVGDKRTAVGQDKINTGDVFGDNLNGAGHGVAGSIGLGQNTGLVDGVGHPVKHKAVSGIVGSFIHSGRTGRLSGNGVDIDGVVGLTNGDCVVGRSGGIRAVVGIRVIDIMLKIERF